MTRSIPIASSFALVLAAACAHEPATPATTTITSGATGGVRVTNVRLDAPDAADRIAAELCRREATCGRIDTASSDEAKLLGEQNCVTQTSARVRAGANRWGCASPGGGAELEECLAAIRSEKCDTRLDRPDVLPRCRPDAVCAAGPR